MTTVLIVTAGSRGDVAPYTGVGVRLQEAGYRVAVATHARFGGLVRDCGLELRPLPPDDDPFRADTGGAGRTFQAGLSSVRSNVRLAADLIRQLAAGIADAATQGADVLLLSTTVAPFGWHVAESLGTPSMGTYLQPASPTRHWAPAFMTGERSLGPWGNRAAARVALRAIDAVIARPTRRLRAELGLPALHPRALRRRLEDEAWPICYGFSPTVLPRPRDWRDRLDVVGYWWPAAADRWTPPRQLVDFLAAGPPPVFVGFGSMGHGRARELSELVSAALRRAGVRGVIQAGAAGLAAPASGDDILAIGDAPHAWLFPRMAALVHHAGAGTAAAGLRAGVPAVLVPFGSDQPFWANRLARLGVCPQPMPSRSLSATGLAEAIRQAVSDWRLRRAVERVAERIRREDGAGRVVEAVGSLVEAERPAPARRQPEHGCLELGPATQSAESL